MSTTEGDELAARIGEILKAKRIRFEAKRMMGGIAFMVEKKMCVGTAKNLLMVRFDPALHDEVLASPGAGPMDFTGRPMRGYAFVKPAALKKNAVLASWLELALDFNPRATSSKKKKSSAASKRTHRKS